MVFLLSAFIRFADIHVLITDQTQFQKGCGVRSVLVLFGQLIGWLVIGVVVFSGDGVGCEQKFHGRSSLDLTAEHDRLAGYVTTSRTYLPARGLVHFLLDQEGSANHGLGVVLQISGAVALGPTLDILSRQYNGPVRVVGSLFRNRHLRQLMVAAPSI